MALKGRRATFAERLSACEAIARGESADLVAQASGFSRSSVFAWWQTYREHGPEALQTIQTRGPATRLSQDQMARLHLLLTADGGRRRQMSLPRILWTREMIADLIHSEFGITLSLVTVSRVLERLGMSPQPLLRRAYERDWVKTQRWKETVFPKIQARAKAAGAAIFFADETSVRTDYDVRSTVMIGASVRQSVWMFSAVSSRGEMNFTIQEGGISVQDFAAFHSSLMARVNRPIFLILANSYFHRSQIESRPRPTLFFLPRYSPELNPA